MIRSATQFEYFCTNGKFPFECISGYAKSCGSG